MAFLAIFKAFLFDLIRFVRVRKRSTYIAFELYRVRLTVSKMKFEISKVFDLDGVRLKSTSGELDTIYRPKQTLGTKNALFLKNSKLVFGPSQKRSQTLSIPLAPQVTGNRLPRKND